MGIPSSPAILLPEVTKKPNVNADSPSGLTSRDDAIAALLPAVAPQVVDLVNLAGVEPLIKTWTKAVRNPARKESGPNRAIFHLWIWRRFNRLLCQTPLRGHCADWIGVTNVSIVTQPMARRVGGPCYFQVTRPHPASLQVSNYLTIGQRFLGVGVLTHV